MIFHLPKQVCFGFLLVLQVNAADTTPDVTPKIIGETIAWQQHLDRGMGLSSNSLSAVNIKIREQSDEVLVTNAGWVLSFGHKGKQSYPINVEKLDQLPQEVISRETIPFMQLRTTTLEVPDYAKHFQKVSSLKPNDRERLLACFIEQACSHEALSFYIKDTGQTIKKPEFWIAPVDLHFPVIMYFVEGVPYIGKVYFDTETLKPIYFDFDYISDDTKWREACFKLMATIRLEGDSFVLENGQLTVSVTPGTSIQ